MTDAASNDISLFSDAERELVQESLERKTVDIEIHRLALQNAEDSLQLYRKHLDDLFAALKNMTDFVNAERDYNADIGDPKFGEMGRVLEPAWDALDAFQKAFVPK